MGLDFDIRLEGIKAARRRYSTTIVKRATRSALNKTIRSARTVASTEIRKKYNIKKKDLDKRTMKVIRARSSNLTSKIVVRSRPISLIFYAARQLKKGVKLTIFKGKRILLPHTFLTTVKAGVAGAAHTGVFKRRGKERLPVAEPKSISPSSMFASDNVMPKVRRTIRDRWGRIFANELRFFIRRSR